MLILLNIIISIIMPVIAQKFGRGSQLHPDFLNSTQIVLDTSRNIDACLFNESLETTVDALGDPCLQVIQNRNSDLEGLLVTHTRSSPYVELNLLLLSSTYSPSHSSSHLMPHSQSSSHSTFYSQTPAQQKGLCWMKLSLLNWTPSHSQSTISIRCGGAYINKKFWSSHSPTVWPWRRLW